MAGEMITYVRGFWAGLFTGAGSGSVSYGDGRWEVDAGANTTAVDGVTEVHVHRGFFWSSLVLVAGASRHTIPGLAHHGAAHLRGLFTVATLPPRVRAAMTAWKAIVARQRYVNHARWSKWGAEQTALREVVRSAEPQWLPAADQVDVRAFTTLFDGLATEVSRLNAEHVERELLACKGLFDTVEKSPLTRMQRVAVVTDEDNTLVVAGAGTGKTSVVVAKVAYWDTRLGVRPEEVLLLAYNKKAAEELRDRLTARTGLSVQASTFHSLGMKVIGEATGSIPPLSKLADGQETGHFVEKIIRAMLQDVRWRGVLVPHLVQYLRPCRGPEEFASQHDFVSYIKGADIRSLRGEPVKSHEECTIADWLFANGIEYEYERRYEHDVSGSGKKWYQPDFYLKESSVYIEHFGIDRNQRTASWVPREPYLASMEWKRKVHREKGTRLVETFSYDRMEGALTQRLSERLLAVGVHPKPRPPAELEAVLDERGVFSVLAKLTTTFLQHFKEGQHNIAALRSSAVGSEPRGRSFLAVFEHVRDEYESKLKAEGAIDFTDMIRLATGHVGSGRFRSPYTRVLVDEFQDTSRGRANLVKALLAQVPDRRLTCVGDDWQSIYRFAGSDISHMTGFVGHFGHAATVDLDRTFRFGERLLKASATFVQKNPAQLKKVLTATRQEDGPPVVVVPMARQQAADDVRAVLERIHREHVGGEMVTVYLLGRYRHNLRASIDSLTAGLKGLTAEFLTVHGSKGRQADYVVLLEVVSGRWGFPAQIEDDPLLGMVLAEPDRHEFAEERRLFYVALTRAKRQVFVLTRPSTRSAFVEEILKPEYEGLVVAEGEMAANVPCACGAAMAWKRNSNDGSGFWSCTDWPYCDGKADTCHVCQRGALVKSGLVFKCSEPGCPGNVEVCPQCREGRIVEKPNSRDGSKFLGCSRYRRDKTGCSYKRDLGGAARRGGFGGPRRR